LVSLAVAFHEASEKERCAVVNEVDSPVFPGFGPPTRNETFPAYGLARVQFEGPWTRPGVPMRVRYRYSHWVGSFDDGSMLFVFDVNAGWCTYAHWRDKTMPWLTGDIPRASGRWHLTHRWQLVFL
jgi:hypothetical protein